MLISIRAKTTCFYLVFSDVITQSPNDSFSVPFPSILFQESVWFHEMSSENQFICFGNRLTSFCFECWDVCRAAKCLCLLQARIELLYSEKHIWQVWPVNCVFWFFQRVRAAELWVDPHVTHIIRCDLWPSHCRCLAVLSRNLTLDRFGSTFQLASRSIRIHSFTR